MDPYCGWPNVTLMVTGENQKRLTERYAHLRRIPAAHYGVSLEPLLGAIDLAEACPCPGCGGEPVWEDIEAQSEVYYEGTDRYTCDHCNVSGIDPRLGWVIVGGESGKNARAIDLDAVRSLRDQCEEASIPFAFKQIGPKGAGNVLDGVVHEGVPERAISANGRKHSQAAG
jgi:protein gp37